MESSVQNSTVPKAKSSKPKRVSKPKISAEEKKAKAIAECEEEVKLLGDVVAKFDQAMTRCSDLEEVVSALKNCKDYFEDELKGASEELASLNAMSH